MSYGSKRKLNYPDYQTAHGAFNSHMRISAKTEDKAVRVMIAKIEYDARQCRDCILERLGMKN